jgi:hypothetical protein
MLYNRSTSILLHISMQRCIVSLPYPHCLHMHYSLQYNAGMQAPLLNYKSRIELVLKLTLNSSVGLSSIKGGVPYRKHHSVTPAAQRSAAYALKCLPLLHISGAQNDHVPSVRVSCARETDFVSRAVSTGVLQYSAQQAVVLLRSCCANAACYTYSTTGTAAMRCGWSPNTSTTVVQRASSVQCRH